MMQVRPSEPGKGQDGSIGIEFYSGSPFSVLSAQIDWIRKVDNFDLSFIRTSYY